MRAAPLFFVTAWIVRRWSTTCAFAPPTRRCRPLPTRRRLPTPSRFHPKCIVSDERRTESNQSAVSEPTWKFWKKEGVGRFLGQRKDVVPSSRRNSISKLLSSRKIFPLAAAMMAFLVLRPATALAASGGMAVKGPVVPLERYVDCCGGEVVTNPKLYDDFLHISYQHLTLCSLAFRLCSFSNFSHSFSHPLIELAAKLSH